MQARIYFDNASTTKINPEVLKTYEKLLENYYANSESLYNEGNEIRNMLDKSRAQIADLLGVNNEEIIFTSGASEANASAIKGVAFSFPNKKHIITTTIEHSSVLFACKQMEEVFGYEVTYLPINKEGLIDLETLKKALRKDTVLVTIMHVNNEIGSILPIKEIAEYVKLNSEAYMHVDCTQSIGKIDVDMRNIDLASFSAHKIHGLKGSGVLMKKKHVPFVELIVGGEQEFGLRGGTTNAISDIVLAKTLRLAMENKDKLFEHAKILQNYAISKLEEIDGILINSPKNNIPCIINFSYEKIPSEVMQNALNERGFMVSARSTCESKNNYSYVIKAMGYSDTRASSCIRLSFGLENNKEEIDLFLEALKEIIKQYG